MKQNKKDIRWASKNEAVPLPSLTAYQEGSQPEMVRVTFHNGNTEDILTLRCNSHIKCKCGINSMLKIINMSVTPKAKRIKSFGKPIAYQSYVTRIAPYANYLADTEHANRYVVYGPVDHDVEIRINEMLLQLEAQKQKTYEGEITEVSITKFRRYINNYIRDNAKHINIYPQESLLEYRNIWGNTES